MAIDNFERKGATIILAAGYSLRSLKDFQHCAREFQHHVGIGTTADQIRISQEHHSIYQATRRKYSKSAGYDELGIYKILADVKKVSIHLRLKGDPRDFDRLWQTEILGYLKILDEYFHYECSVIGNLKSTVPEHADLQTSPNPGHLGYDVANSTKLW